MEMAIGHRIRVERKKRKWSQEDLASYLGYHNAMVSYWESGNHYPPLETIKELCELFECKSSDLLGF